MRSFSAISTLIHCSSVRLGQMVWRSVTTLLSGFSTMRDLSRSRARGAQDGHQAGEKAV